VKAAAPPRPVRVAIYTRKSIAERHDQEFGSLEAQRQAIDAYVASQAGLGWVAAPKRYDDDGFTGANLDRPAFAELLRDIAAGHVDTVAVYKIDRLSRSLPDFAQLIDLFERHGVAFVSVTQQFSTANSIGKLTLNVLMSFAEFEREVISERIRDKVQATRRRGMWTGGRPVLGYDVVAKKLVVNVDEADRVRAIFDLYVALGSIGAVTTALRDRGWLNKSFVGKRGQPIAGGAFTKGTLHGLLTNALYRGQIRTKDGLVAGEHEAIVSAETWDAVQELLQANRGNGGADVRNKTGALLRGLLRCGRCKSPMLHTFTTSGSVRHRYYVCSRTHNEGKAACPGCRVPAGKFEAFVVGRIRIVGVDDALLTQTAAAANQQAAERRRALQAEQRHWQGRLRGAPEVEPRAEAQARLTAIEAELHALGEGTVDADRLALAVSAFEPVWDQLFPRERERILRLLIAGVTYDPDTGDAEIELRPCGIETLALEATT
jgi:site-specific DNA recombinase